MRGQLLCKKWRLYLSQNEENWARTVKTTTIEENWPVLKLSLFTILV